MYRYEISIVDILALLTNSDIDNVILENIDIDKDILKNINIDKDILENIDIDIVCSPIHLLSCCHFSFYHLFISLDPSFLLYCAVTSSQS